MFFSSKVPWLDLFEQKDCSLLLNYHLEKDVYIQYKRTLEVCVEMGAVHLLNYWIRPMLGDPQSTHNIQTNNDAACVFVDPVKAELHEWTDLYWNAHLTANWVHPLRLFRTKGHRYSIAVGGQRKPPSGKKGDRDKTPADRSRPLSREPFRGTNSVSPNYICNLYYRE